MAWNLHLFRGLNRAIRAVTILAHQIDFYASTLYTVQRPAFVAKMFDGNEALSMNLVTT